MVTAAGHVPAPLQFADAVSRCVVLLQLAVRQLVDVDGNVQPSDVPSHDPPQGAVPAPVHAPRVPCGCPLVRRVHVPTLPPTSHASHDAPHVVSQQTPSMQFPDVHCPP